MLFPPAPSFVCLSAGRAGKQQAMIDDSERVPTAVELAWVLTIYHSVRNIYLLRDLYARTSSVASDGGRVSLSCFDKLGLYVSRYKDVGLAPIRKL